MERFRPLLAALRLDRALLAPCAVFVGSSFARFDAQPGPGIPAHLAVSFAALLAAAGVNLVDDAWDRVGAPPGDPMDARDAAIVGALCLLAALLVGSALVPLSGAAAIGYGFLAVLLGLARGVPAVGLDSLGRGLSDLANAIALGPLAVLAGFASQAGHGSTGAALIGIPAGFAAAGALYARHFTRRDADARHERLTPVDLLGEDRARVAWMAFPAVSFLAAGAIVAASEAPAGILASGAPLAVYAGLTFRASHDRSADFERLGQMASAASAAALVTLAVALRLAVR